MIIFVTFICLFAHACSARPEVGNIPHNVVTVPPNCPDGQEWVNGQCRDIWRVTAAPANVVTVPSNCPPGQVFVNGQCRDIWLRSLSELNNFGKILSNYAHYESKNVVTAPPNCRPGQQWVNGSCRDVWRSGGNKNVITVPTNCLPGEEFINGKCREIWRRSPNLIENFFNDFKNLLAQKERQVENQEELSKLDDHRNVISVPNQCPAGYRPDALGVCREIFI